MGLTEVNRSADETLGATCPATTMFVVAALLRDEWRVEIEAEALASR